MPSSLNVPVRLGALLMICLGLSCLYEANLLCAERRPEAHKRKRDEVARVEVPTTRVRLDQFMAMPHGPAGALVWDPVEVGTAGALPVIAPVVGRGGDGLRGVVPFVGELGGAAVDHMRVFGLLSSYRPDWVVIALPEDRFDAEGIWFDLSDNTKNFIFARPHSRDGQWTGQWTVCDPSLGYYWLSEYRTDRKGVTRHNEGKAPRAGDLRQELLDVTRKRQQQLQDLFAAQGGASRVARRDRADAHAGGAARAVAAAVADGGAEDDVVLVEVPAVPGLDMRRASRFVEGSGGAAAHVDPFAGCPTIPSGQFIVHALGVEEDLFADHEFLQRAFNIEAATGDIILDATSRGGKRLSCGRIQIARLAELRAHWDERPVKGGGSLHVIEGVNPTASGNTHVLRVVDIGSLQAMMAFNCRARGLQPPTIQVASNTSCLEVIGCRYPSRSVTPYLYDYTQGPGAVRPASSGLMVRQYGMWGALHGFDATPVVRWGQSGRHAAGLEWNMFAPACSGDRLPMGISMPFALNGHLIVNGRQAMQIAKFAPAQIDRVCAQGYQDVLAREMQGRLCEQGLFDVLMHRNQPLFYALRCGEGEHDRYEVLDGTLNVHHVFASALDIGVHPRSGNVNEKTPQSTQIANAILDVTAESCIRAAVANGSSVVVMTLVGLGAFDNDAEGSLNALEKHLALLQESGLVVYLNLFSGVALTPEQKSRLLRLVHRCNGSYTLYARDGVRFLDTGRDSYRAACENPVERRACNGTFYFRDHLLGIAA